jgi:hypothetical protein
LAFLTDRWTLLRHHILQSSFWNAPHRFNVLPCGRRSGKTELCKRKLVLAALRANTGYDDPRYFAAAPTYAQAKRIYWKDLKALMPREFIADVSESELCITTKTGGQLFVVGMDKPERIEGTPWDGGVLDEFANMKASAWGENVRPALSDRGGWCDLIGVPEGRNHYYDLWQRSQADMLEHGPASTWGGYHWISADILPDAEIAEAKRDLDPLTFAQEYEGSFVNFEGRAYYPFDAGTHTAKLADRYQPAQPLILCFDFNVAPGVAAICQEMLLPNGEQGTGYIGEVHIPRNSNTPAVVAKLVQDWGHHRGAFICYGDATGGAGGTAKVSGSDWDIVSRDMEIAFGDRVEMRVPRSNPKERSRVNAVNSRLKAGDDTVRMMVDPTACPNMVRDFEGVRLLAGGSGELDKKHDTKLTHISDAAGYYIAAEFPVVEREFRQIRAQGV